MPVPRTVFAAAAAAALIIPFSPARARADVGTIDARGADAIRRRTLPSGLRVIVAERPGTGLAAIDLRVRLGSGSETPETSGTAHFVEHLVFKGTDSRRPGDIDRAIESLGGELTAQTTRDATRFAVTLPAKGWPDALAVMADMLRHPAFRAEDVAAEKSPILAEMAIARTEPMRAGYAALAAGGVYGPDDPYRLPLMGTEENVRAMTPDRLRAFWSRAYRPDDMTLAVAGDVRADDVLAAAERLFPADAAAPPALAPDAPPARPAAGEPAAAAAARVPIDPEGPKRPLVTVFFGFRAPAAASSAADAVRALLPLLASGADSGGGTASGRLAEALVLERKLAVSVSADLVEQRTGGMVVIAATGPADSAARLENGLRAVLGRLILDGFTEDDTAAGRRALLGARAVADATVDGLAARLAAEDVLGSPSGAADDPAALRAARLQKSVTAASLTAAARRYLDPDHAVVAVVGAPSP